MAIMDLYGINIINYFKPKFFFVENVGGLATANGGKILSDLESAGDEYNLTVNLYKAEQYGIPQTHHRIIVIGISKKDSSYKVPKPTHVSAGEAIENLPIPSYASNNELTKQSKPSYTITGSRGGKTHCHHWKVTNCEQARLQTFSDNYIFYGNK